jgi:hypothetical protein
LKKASYSTVGVDFLNFVADKFFALRAISLPRPCALR